MQADPLGQRQVTEFLVIITEQVKGEWFAFLSF
jgi:hypothetical protein